MFYKRLISKNLLRILFFLIVIDMIQPMKDNNSLEIESVDNSLNRMIYQHIPKTGV